MEDLHNQIVLAQKVEVMPGLFVGSQWNFEDANSGLIDFEKDPYFATNHWHPLDWRILHVAKEPYHRKFVGYKGRAAPKDSDEYLIAIRGHRMALNLIDSPDPACIPIECIQAGVNWILGGMDLRRNVFVHCNMGVSRSPSLAMIAMARICEIPTDLKGARAEFEKRYDRYMPGEGMSKFLEKNWDLLIKGEEDGSL